MACMLQLFSSKIHNNITVCDLSPNRKQCTIPLLFADATDSFLEVADNVKQIAYAESLKGTTYSDD